jgi:hypothetical protein
VLQKLQAGLMQQSHKAIVAYMIAIIDIGDTDSNLRGEVKMFG